MDQFFNIYIAFYIVSRVIALFITHRHLKAIANKRREENKLPLISGSDLVFPIVIAIPLWGDSVIFAIPLTFILNMLCIYFMRFINKLY